MHDGTGDQPVAAPAQPQGTQPRSADAELAAVQTQRPALKLESGTCQDAAKPVAASPPDRTLPNDFKNPFEPFSTAPIADTTTELPLQIGEIPTIQIALEAEYKGQGRVTSRPEAMARQTTNRLPEAANSMQGTR